MSTSVSDTEAPVVYNVFCGSCGQIFTPPAKSALWWKAKKRADKGFLDAHQCTGKECGCVKDLCRPDAPFRVFGYDAICADFDIPCATFVEAVKACRTHKHDILCVEGVYSNEVKRRLRICG